MKRNEVKVGGRYTMKVGRNELVVTIREGSPDDGWVAVLPSGKEVVVRDPERLGKAPRPTKAEVEAARARSAADQENARLREEREESGDVQTAGERAMTESAPAPAQPEPSSPDTEPAETPNPDERGEPSAKRAGILGAAVRVLEERGADDGPLSCAAMVERMTQRGYWSPAKGGKTPANTLYAAILREIRERAEASRFVKVERGRFSLTERR